MAKKRSHGKIDNLPESIRMEVDRKLIEGHTYAQTAEYLKGMGQNIHPMSVGRYGKPFLERFEAIRIAKQYAKVIAEDNIDRPTTELHEANNAMISQILMETLLSDDIEPSEKIKAANSIAQLQSAQIRNEKLKIDARKASGDVYTAFKIFKAQIYKQIAGEYPDLADKIIKIADNAVGKVTNEILQ